MKNQILVIGSVVRDVTHFSNGEKQESLGGTGTNIAFGLGVLGLKPNLISVVGYDFDKKFENFLKKNGITLHLVKDNGGKTASFSEKFGYKANIADEIKKIKLKDLLGKDFLKKVKVGIFSPGTPASTTKHIQEFRKNTKNALVIFDPGQMTEFYSKAQFEKCIKLCNVLILNELEFFQIEKILKKDLLKLFKNKILIKTIGEKGSDVYEKGKRCRISVVKAKKVVSTVGAGDAYRVGLIYGLLNKKSLENACKIGAKFSSKSVEKVGCHKAFFKI